MTGCFMTGGMAGSRGNISLAGLHRKLAQGKWVGGTGEETEPGNITDLITIKHRQAGNHLPEKSSFQIKDAIQRWSFSQI